MTPIDYPAPSSRKGRRAEKRRGDSVETMRVFVAVFPSEPVLEALRELRRRLEPSVPGLRWVSAANLHFTLRFFGDMTREEATRAGSVLDEVAAETVPFDLELSGLGAFPGWRRPRVLWVGSTTGSAVLEALARSLERGFRDARLGKADKRFVPHLTLGRWRDARGLDLNEAEAAAKGVEKVASFAVKEVGVIQSHLGPGGSTYVPLHTARFSRNT
jgi:2'-5' RNA ligase